MSNDYKDSLNLPKTAFPMKANLAKKEIELLEFWKDEDIYRKMLEKDRSKSYILHDGPPYANGHLHLGHALNKILKDMIIKYKAMQGHYAPFVPGWDCHGLPIEHQVDKKLGKKKRDTSITEKRKLCREYAKGFVDIQRDEFKRLGVFGDWDNPYITMDYNYEGTIVKEFNRFFESGMVYKGKKPVHWCPTCVTALAEAEVEHADKESPSIYVKFKIKNQAVLGDEYSAENVSIVIWTTTPWTIPANKGLAVHEDIEYALVKNEGEILILADELVNRLKDKGILSGSAEVLKTIKGKDLIGLLAEHPFVKTNKDDGERIIFCTNFVSIEEGTGVVHIAPGHGEDDFEEGQKHGLEVYTPVNDYGKFTEEVEEFAGQKVFAANEGIINKIKGLGASLGSPKNISHSYPHCWRCKRPVIFRATEQWFISMEAKDLRQNALKEIKNTKWIPGWGMDRIYGMVEKRPDWCISRQRSWGVPITLIQCEKCSEFVSDRKVMEKIEQEVETSGADVWFEKSEKELLPDGYKCKCGSDEFKKETDILDVWFDSGVSHAAVVEADERLSSPADLYLEGSDQHRGWFQSSLLASVGTRNMAPYRAVLTHGFVVDGKGKKMSKSIGNVISPKDITQKHGAEILRLWCSSADYRDDMKISNEIMARLVEAYRKIRNTSRFILGNLNDFDPADAEIDIKNLSEIDRVALSMLQDLIKKVTTSYETFAFYEVYHAIYQFCIVDMSSFYFDILKDRLYTYKTDSVERRNAQVILYNILKTLTKLIAPILSFTAEEIWQYLPGEEKESVFVADFPQAKDEYIIDEALNDKWRQFAAIRAEVNKSLEIKRADKLIGNALEARVTIYVIDKTKVELEEQGDFLPTLFIVSAVDVKDISEAPDSAYSSGDVKDLAVLVEKADGSKCQRCWNRSASVGHSDEHPELCKRCCNVLKN